MKSIQILTALKLLKSKETSAHCSTLANIYAMLQEIKQNIVSASIIEETTLMVGRHTVNEWRHGKYENIVRNEGIEMPAVKIEVKTQSGSYTFTIPSNNTFCDAIGALLGINMYKDEVAEIVVENTMVADSAIINAIIHASKFVSRDTLRPAMMKICLHISKGKIAIVATDAHRLYFSKQYTCTDPSEKKLMIDTENVKLLSAIKVKNSKTILKFSGNQLFIEGIKFDLHDQDRYPDYQAVIPEYNTHMLFDKKEFLQCVNGIMPAANKVTHQIKLHLNGSIELSAADLDFDNENACSMRYDEKTFPDSDLYVNGKFMLGCFAPLKGKQIKMQTYGARNRAIIFTDECQESNVLLMPLHIKD